MTSIIATIGPASNSRKILKEMHKAGMDGVRINTSHADIKDCKKIINTLKNIRVIKIIALQGRSIRLKTNKTRKVKKRDIIIIGFDKRRKISFNHNFYKSIKIGGKFLFDDGRIRAEVVKKNKGNVHLKFIDDGLLKNDDGVNYLSKINLPVLTKKDEKVIKLAKKEKINYVTVPFTESKKDILDVKKKGIKVIAKIESWSGVKNIDRIIDVCDGVLIGRGDLSLQIGIERVPKYQKIIISKCKKKRKLVITATQFLTSMLSSTVPDMADISDIVLATTEGSDYLMLSEETAIGKYPVLAIKKMKKAISYYTR